METIRNYTAPSRLFLGYATTFAIGITPIGAQVFAPEFAQQGLDLIDSFFIYALLSQFVHLGWAHLALNLAGLALLAWGFSAQRSQNEWLWIQALSMPWIAFYLTAIEPLSWYCGLSGALHFQFAACLLLALYRSPRTPKASWPLYLLLIGLCVKLLLEWNSGHTTDELVGGPIAFQAHRGGALGGVFLGIFIVGNAFFSRQRSA